MPGPVPGTYKRNGPCLSELKDGLVFVTCIGKEMGVKCHQKPLEFEDAFPPSDIGVIQTMPIFLQIENTQCALLERTTSVSFHT